MNYIDHAQWYENEIVKISISVGTEDTSEIFYEDGISFIPLRSWGREGKPECHLIYCLLIFDWKMKLTLNYKIGFNISYNDAIAACDANPLCNYIENEDCSGTEGFELCSSLEKDRKLCAFKKTEKGEAITG